MIKKMYAVNNPMAERCLVVFKAEKVKASAKMILRNEGIVG